MYGDKSQNKLKPHNQETRIICSQTTFPARPEEIKINNNMLSKGIKNL